MTTLYILIAIFLGGLQGYFMYLSNKQGQKEAHEETQKNLVESFKKLDAKTKKELLLNSDLTKDEIIFLVNNQTKSAALEIVSTTINEFQIIQKDLDKKEEKLESIGKNTDDIFNKINDESKYINPQDFKISFIADVISKNKEENSITWLTNLTKNENFKIWITFNQDDLKMFTYLDSKGNWSYNNNIDYSEKKYSGHKYASFPTNNRILVKNGDLILEDKNSNNRFTTNKKLHFEVHLAGDYMHLNFLNFQIKTMDGNSIKPIEIELKNVDSKFDIINKSEFKYIKTKTVLEGYFEFK